MKDLFFKKNRIIFYFSVFFIIFILAAVFGLFFFSKKSLAAENLAVVCDLDNVQKQCDVLSSGDCKKLLEKCEQYYVNESNKIENDLSKTKTQKNTLQNAVNSLSQKIKNLNYQISQSNLVITDIKIQIEDTTKSIDITSTKIDNLKEQLSDILKSINAEDKKSLIEVLFSEADLSGFYNNLTALETLNSRSKQLLENIKSLKNNLETEKDSLDDEKGSLERTVKVQTLQKAESDKAKKEQEQTLKLTEKQYQEQLKKQQENSKKVAEIRARIFELIGVSKAPTFGEAYEIAKSVSNITGVRPAFLLAVLTQESNIGKNVGQCYLTNTENGSGTNVKSGAIVKNVMKPMGGRGRKGDVDSFLKITEELGRVWNQTPVSCPMSFGYGGAMGPAQFIPTTWLLYYDKIKNAKGKAGDPWDINDAFLAAGLYLANFGANSQNYNKEWSSAMAYFSGSTKPNSAYNFYANSVMKIATGYGDDIKAIEDSK